MYGPIIALLVFLLALSAAVAAGGVFLAVVGFWAVGSLVGLAGYGLVVAGMKWVRR